jgi:CHAT domain-containing protein
MQNSLGQAERSTEFIQQALSIAREERDSSLLTGIASHLEELGELGDGTEILGFGYLMQQAGAKAAIASLWSVDDGGTQALMNAFYGGLQEKMTKAEALRQAQIALITGDYTAVGGERGTIGIVWLDRSSETVTPFLSHPYYWASFILIGNGL